MQNQADMSFRSRPAHGSSLAMKLSLSYFVLIMVVIVVGTLASVVMVKVDFSKIFVPASISIVVAAVLAFVETLPIPP